MQSNQRTYTPLARFRVLHGLKQKDLADRIGVSSRSIARWEKGMTSPHTYYIQKLCQELQSTEAELGLRKKPPAPMAIPLVVDSVPARPLPMFPRTDLLETLCRRILHHQHGQRLALTAPSGMGKTTVSLLLEHRALWTLFDGFLWANGEDDLPSIFSRWGRLLDVAELLEEASSLSHPVQHFHRSLLRYAIGQRRLLIVLDHITSVEQAMDLWVGGSRCTYLFLTRTPHTVGLLAPEQTLRLEPLGKEESWSWLSRLAPRALADYGQEAVQPFLQLARGIPGTLRLIGNALEQSTQKQSSYRRQQQKLSQLYHDLETRLLP